MSGLTKQQRKVLDFINYFIKTHGYSPSVEEIALGVGLKSKATVHAHIQNLCKKGMVKSSYNRARSIEPVDQSPFETTAAAIPLLGTISAGNPIEAIEENETINLPAEMVGRNETFVLRVKGDSMIDEHIIDEDYVIVEKRDSADNGETVVALIDGTEATVKKFHFDGSVVRLEPRNPNMEPMEFSPERVIIRGAVIGVLRGMKRRY